MNLKQMLDTLWLCDLPRRASNRLLLKIPITLWMAVLSCCSSGFLRLVQYSSKSARARAVSAEHRGKKALGFPSFIFLMDHLYIDLVIFNILCKKVDSLHRDSMFSGRNVCHFFSWLQVSFAYWLKLAHWGEDATPRMGTSGWKMCHLSREKHPCKSAELCCDA